MSGTYNVFAYDGSYEGFLCVAVKCINLRIFPAKVVISDGRRIEDGCCFVRTDYVIAEKMHNFLSDRACVQVQQMVVDGFLTDMADRERALIDLIGRAMKYGACVADDYEHRSLRRIHDAILDLYREEQSYFVELETEEYKEARTAVIDPRNRVLPVMKYDIIRKTDHTNLFIYDRRHSMVLFKKEEADDIVDISRLALARRDDVRYVYDSVWQYLASGEHLDRRICNRRKASAYERLWYIAV